MYNEYLRPETVTINQLLLDANNPRFAIEGEKVYSDKQIGEPEIQEKTLQKMQSGKYAVDELRGNMLKVGFLKIDRIVVRPLSGSSTLYVVLEGNRRTAALKSIVSDIAEKELDPDQLDESVRATFDSLEVLVYTGQEKNSAWLFQGLRHVSGVREWPAYQKAKLLVDQMEQHGLGLREAGETFGVSGQQAGVWVRSYYGYRQMKNDEEWGDMVEPRLFAYLGEVFGRGGKPIRDWLGWNEDESRFENTDNLKTFITWLVPTEDDGVPAITQAIALRQVAKLRMESDEHFQKFSSGSHTLEEAVGEHLAARTRKKIEAETTMTDYLQDLEELARRIRRLPMLGAMERRKDVEDILKRVQADILNVLEQLG